MINKNYIEVKDIDKAKDLLYEFNLPEDFIEKNIRIGENGSRLSGGQKQKLSIARAIWRNPEILFLDEATSSMDKATQDFVMKLIFKKMKNKTIIMISHRDETLKLFNKILTLPSGNVLIKNN